MLTPQPDLRPSIACQHGQTSCENKHQEMDCSSPWRQPISYKATDSLYILTSLGVFILLFCSRYGLAAPLTQQYCWHQDHDKLCCLLMCINKAQSKQTVCSECSNKLQHKSLHIYAVYDVQQRYLTAAGLHAGDAEE